MSMLLQENPENSLQISSEICDRMFDEKANTVTITVICCNPEKIRDKLCCKGRKIIKSIEIKEPPKPAPPPTPKEPEKPKLPGKPEMKKSPKSPKNLRNRESPRSLSSPKSRKSLRSPRSPRNRRNPGRQHVSHLFIRAVLAVGPALKVTVEGRASTVMGIRSLSRRGRATTGFVHVDLDTHMEGLAMLRGAITSVTKALQAA
ncbi:pollen-specific leucine-rich repeat extensin 1 [Olea europaea subsp. europaea]|uniref:Pollen-specific leucine-rich repeat extensin 1 n=1 Tax=Olea europaea subsp. europaea TaxID=158383 RepID=A0A8S0U0U1_OLEEU|nr:pollen-specific leucine-rich repeat extensin 1 [Olea europaea subsp. europaea]